jgi:hypothetical protein
MSQVQEWRTVQEILGGEEGVQLFVDGTSAEDVQQVGRFKLALLRQLPPGK